MTVRLYFLTVFIQLQRGQRHQKTRFSHDSHPILSNNIYEPSKILHRQWPVPVELLVSTSSKTIVERQLFRKTQFFLVTVRYDANSSK